jgi:hypothetical protein
VLKKINHFSCAQYINSDLFWKNIFPFITNPFILITLTEGEDVLPGRYFKHLDNDKVIAWFTINLDDTHNHIKLHSLPLGHVWKSRSDMLLDAFELGLSKPWVRRKHENIWMMSQTNLKRKSILESLQKQTNVNIQPIYTESNPQKHMLQLYTSTKYVFSPPGAGLDCHRTWEALTAGAIPVVFNYKAMRAMVKSHEAIKKAMIKYVSGRWNKAAFACTT